MALKSENDIWDSAELDENELSIEDLEANLEAELEMQLSDLSVLEEEKEQIENPDNLCKVIRRNNGKTKPNHSVASRKKTCGIV